MPKFLLVAQREYVKVIRKPSFWLSTLLFPALMTVLIFISGYSSTSVENKMKEELARLKLVLVMDESGLIDPSQVTAPFEIITDKDKALESVKSGTADAFIDYGVITPTGVNVQVYGQDRGLIANGIYSELTSQLLKQNLLQGLKDPVKIAMFSTPPSVTTKTYNQGVEVTQGAESLIVPGALVMIYILLISFSSSYLLFSVSEEKENRVIETVLSIIRPSQLITGKIIGQVSIIITQLSVLLSLVLVVLLATHTQLPFDFSQLHLTFAQIAGSLFYMLAGFLIIANIMVGVGAAMPTYKEAQSFSSIFMLLSFIPLYFATMIIAEPSGTVAMITSYFPLTAALIMMFRSALGVMSTTEQLFSIAVLILYVLGTLWLAYKLFVFGSLEYSQKISFRRFLTTLRGKRMVLNQN